jgi:hypothetical protein
VFTAVAAEDEAVDDDAVDEDAVADEEEATVEGADVKEEEDEEGPAVVEELQEEEDEEEAVEDAYDVVAEFKLKDDNTGVTDSVKVGATLRTGEVVILTV